MKRLFLSIFVIFAAASVSASAQNFSARQFFEKAVAAAGGEKFTAALPDFRRALALAETEDAPPAFRARLHFNIGVCLYRTNETRAAVDELEKAARLDAGYDKTFYALGMARAELRDWQAAEAAFTRGLTLNAKNAEAWFDLAFVYLARENAEAARLAFEKAIKFKSVDAATAHNNVGVIFAVRGDLDAAVKEFETALKKSGGKFAVAERNLQFCRSLGKTDLVAKLEYGR